VPAGAIGSRFSRMPTVGTFFLVLKRDQVGAS
jgi:hypothetical protein